MACEDYPCCGHEPGDCPREDADGNKIWSCARCRVDLPAKHRSSLCERCLVPINDEDGDCFDPEPDFQD